MIRARLLPAQHHNHLVLSALAAAIAVSLAGPPAARAQSTEGLGIPPRPAEAQQEQVERQKKIDAAVATGEVAVGILPPGKH